MRSLILALLLLPTTVAVASTERPTDAELSDWMTFLRSLSIPVMGETCPALLPEGSEYGAVAARWLSLHQAEIGRGRDFARAGTPAGKDFDQLHSSMVTDFRQKLLAKPDSDKVRLCTESLNTLQKGAPAGGA